MVLGKNVAIFDWEWDRNPAPRDGQKIPCISLESVIPSSCLVWFDIYTSQSTAMVMSRRSVHLTIHCTF